MKVISCVRTRNKISIALSSMSTCTNMTTESWRVTPGLEISGIRHDGACKVGMFRLRLAALYRVSRLEINPGMKKEAGR